MMTKHQFFLKTEQIKANCQNVIAQLPTDNKKPLVVKIQPMTRSLEQNNKLHAMLTDIANQCEFQGGKLSMLQWKGLLVSAFMKAEYDEEPLIVEFEGIFYNLRQSTADMGVRRTAKFIEYLTAWGVENGVQFNDKYGFWGR